MCCSSCFVATSAMTCSTNGVIIFCPMASYVMSPPFNFEGALDWTSRSSPLGAISYWLKFELLKLSLKVAIGEIYINFGYVFQYAFNFLL
jgi:hypothetical protein